MVRALKHPQYLHEHHYTYSRHLQVCVCVCACVRVQGWTLPHRWLPTWRSFHKSVCLPRKYVVCVCESQTKVEQISAPTRSKKTAGKNVSGSGKSVLRKSNVKDGRVWDESLESTAALFAQWILPIVNDEIRNMSLQDYHRLQLPVPQTWNSYLLVSAIKSFCDKVLCHRLGGSQQHEETSQYDRGHAPFRQPFLGSEFAAFWAFAHCSCQKHRDKQFLFHKISLEVARCGSVLHSFISPMHDHAWPTDNGCITGYCLKAVVVAVSPESWPGTTG